MRRKRKIEEPENADRWVVSYADFITLLFALFTTLYAISHVDLGKLERFTGSMRSAFKVSGIEAVSSNVIVGIKPVNYVDVGLEKDLQEAFNKFGILEGIVISRDQRGVILSFSDALLFESGSADLRKEARPFLATAAALIKRSQRLVSIEGHTDNLPLRSTRYASNLELSTARASRTYSFLLDEEVVNPERLSASGYGEYRPAASNASLEGRTRNRRVDIVFASKRDGT